MDGDATLTEEGDSAVVGDSTDL